MPQVYVTPKIKQDLENVKPANQNQVTEEGLVNVILRLTLSDEQEMKKIVNLIKRAQLGGELDLEKKGW
jgi:hypothetical protein